MNLTLTELSERVKSRRELPSPAARRALRREAGISAAELAEALGVTEGAVLTWERGTREPRGRNRDGYIQALRILSRTGG
jgi:DNA-binding transcriptional regulator YiaG